MAHHKVRHFVLPKLLSLHIAFVGAIRALKKRYDKSSKKGDFRHLTYFPVYVNFVVATNLFTEKLP